MDNVTRNFISHNKAIRDEIARINPETVFSNFEQLVRKDINNWIINNPIKTSDLNVKEIATMFWNFLV